MADPALTRRQRLGELVLSHGFLRVADASRMLGVSEVTVRADLSLLETDGQLTRVHGGAVPATAVREFPLEQTVRQDADIKRRIGERAAAMVRSGESVLLDVGSTALAAARALVARDDLRDNVVITNGLSIALALEPAIPRFTVVVIGGTLRPLQHSLVDPHATDALSALHADVSLIGCNGVDAEAGVTNLNLAEAQVKRAMVRSSTRRILLADASKLGRRHLGRIGALQDFDVLVTAGNPGEELLDPVRRCGVAVECADPGHRSGDRK
ncbi:DeoR/GlpR family DNA-binding transcription regulator [Lysobacter korlensis]|uniref:DeoR/GlpR family DNA-binding transcription regulator n=1 Tax=Lysobacter korlensis TaxID=553636 RepID=A0ABV6RV31_9GAMM